MDKYTSKIEVIISKICDYFGEDKENVLSHKRQKNLVLPRHIIMYIIRKEIGFSYPKIAKIMHKRDHTTIIHGINSITKKIEEDSDFAFILQRLMDSFDIGLIGDIKGVANNHKFSKIFEIYGSRCVSCGFDDIIHIHHIIPKKEGGSDETSNLIVLCPNCHAMIHAGLLQIKRSGKYKIINETVNK